jgi:hypothetical protein
MATRTEEVSVRKEACRGWPGERSGEPRGAKGPRTTAGQEVPVVAAVAAAAAANTMGVTVEAAVGMAMAVSVT